MDDEDENYVTVQPNKEEVLGIRVGGQMYAESIHHESGINLFLVHTLLWWWGGGGCMFNKYMM